MSYLCAQTDFKKKNNWLFYAVDFKENLIKVNALIFQMNIHRRVGLIELNHFYDVSIQELEAASPTVLVCRNVMHELDIDATTDLFNYLIKNLFDVLILQDLMNFKQGERGNVCSDNEILKCLFRKIGLSGNYKSSGI